MDSFTDYLVEVGDFLVSGAKARVVNGVESIVDITPTVVAVNLAQEHFYAEIYDPSDAYPAVATLVREYDACGFVYMFYGYHSNGRQFGLSEMDPLLVVQHATMWGWSKVTYHPYVFDLGGDGKFVDPIQNPEKFPPEWEGFQVFKYRMTH